MYIVPDRQKRYNIDRLGEVGAVKRSPHGGESMAVTKAQQKAVSKYMKENYDEIKVRVPKGEKETIQAHAEAHSESVNGFINRAISETMERDNGAAEK